MASISSSSSSSSSHNPFRFVWRMYHSITMQYLRLSPPIPMNIPDQLHGTVVGYDYEVVIAAADSRSSHGSSSAIDGLYQPHSALISAPFPTGFPRDMYYYSVIPFQFLPIPNNINGVVVPSPYWAQDSPLQYRQIDIERQQYFQPLIPIPQSQDDGEVRLGKTFLSLTFQAAVGFMVFYYQSLFSSTSSSSDHVKSLLPPPLALHIFEAAMTVGFSGSLIGILLRDAYPIPAGIIEKTGSISAALGFFVMVCMLLPGTFIWIGWLGGVGSVVAFSVAVKKMKRE